MRTTSLLLVALLVLLSSFISLSEGKKDCGCDAKKEVDTIHCEGDVCHQTKDSLLIARTRDYWYSMLLKDPALYDKVTGYFTDDVELWAQSGLVVQGRAALSAAIRSNGIVLYNNYAVEDFETWVASDGGAVWVTMKRGETNLYTNVSGLVDYVARLDFTPEGNISAVHEFPNYEECARVLPQVVPHAKGAVEYYMCMVLTLLCPHLNWGVDSQGNNQTCYQLLINYREYDPDTAPRFTGASKRCFGVNLTNLSPATAAMFCPLFAKGNGSPMGCWD